MIILRQLDTAFFFQIGSDGTFVLIGYSSIIAKVRLWTIIPPFIGSNMFKMLAGQSAFSGNTHHFLPVMGQLRFRCERVRTVALRHIGLEVYIVPDTALNSSEPADTLLWILPIDVLDTRYALEVRLPSGTTATTLIDENGITVSVVGGPCVLIEHVNRPRCTVLGEKIEVTFAGSDILLEAMAGFYWDTMLPSVIEQTLAKNFPCSDGYVVSTLHPNHYRGTYPDVDHEFQIKGRLAIGDAADLAVVKRMIDLQLKLMREDPTGRWRNPGAVQHDGTREYEVLRRTMDGTVQAEMFLLTGNVEILEEAWLVYALTHEREWLEARIEDLEGAASLIVNHIDYAGRVWSDVYYEDQVMKDGRNVKASCFAAHGLSLIAGLEHLLGRHSQAAAYDDISKRVSQNLVRRVPYGFWDETSARFVDWIDRYGVVHDHIHVLANELPTLFEFASPEQASSADRCIKTHLHQFQRFPTFVAAKIEDYTDSEIGDGGPYDLCAAGRYWCWDAAYHYAHADGKLLLSQLNAVAVEGRRDRYRMGERYDMDHVYYVDGKSWHGASDYYEYPCVYNWVLFHEFLGIRPTIDADLLIAPCLPWPIASVRLEASHIAVAYELDSGQFTITNLASRSRRIRIELGRTIGWTNHQPHCYEFEAGASRSLRPEN